MIIELLSRALDARQLLAFDYDGQPRLVEPHALGLNKKEQLSLRAFQVDGGSATMPTGWKLFTMEKAVNLRVVDVPASQAPRPGYKTGDGAMVTILAELPAPQPEEVAA